MSKRNTFVRSLHDLGLATWFGGSLMGAVGLNGATAQADSSEEKLRLSSLGWARWAPVQIGAIVLHGVGGIGLIVGNKERIAADSGTRVNTIVKFALTVIACGATLYSAFLGKKIAENSDQPTEGVTEPSSGSSPELASAQNQQRIVQWALPAVTGVLIILGAQQGEQQRPLAGLLNRFTR